MRILKKTVMFTVASALMAASVIPAAMAIDGGVNVGKNFTDVTVGMGQESEGLYINGNWIKNTENGREKTGAEAGVNMKAGAVDVNVGIQADYVKGATGNSEGVVFPVGVGVKIPVISQVGLYGSMYTAPRQMSNTTKSYLDADAGVSWQPVDLVTLKAGYRYIGMDGKGTRENQRLIEGPYIGGQVNF
ncbi:YfaZ family outer membrane protein [Erwinia sp. MMLR14_017]|uniref:YfaZ family outer membrane protein n=1 Tax=Erwinia sp. MMLR14_017 TaxID=3093842 RepID=UPI0029904D76|nr:YfaZ family outer membrane protein [Erwinia sp. MMLR14_017]MDW8847665.1 YfaZ family outer membrane protein [Erwinia sp. MMLR14_017]